MRPYYSTEDGIIIYHGDAKSVLSSLSIFSDIIVTDPPYGIGYKSNHATFDFGHIVNDKSSDRNAIIGIIALAVKTLRAGRHVYMFGGLSPGEAETCGLTQPVELIWNKIQLNMGDLRSVWATSHEAISFCCYYPSKQNRLDGKGNLSSRLRRGSVLSCPRLVSKQNNRHPTEKPVAILRTMIESSSMIQEVVLDPFAGVGSTCVAAALEDRQSIGIEIEERYCEIAAKRLENLDVERKVSLGLK